MEKIERVLGLVALCVLLGLVAALLLVFLRIERRGIILRVEGPIQAVVVGPSLEELKVTLTLPQTVALDVRARAQVEGAVQAELGGLGIPCPKCGEGVLLPVRWSLWSGEITWRCTSCGKP